MANPLTHRPGADGVSARAVPAASGPAEYVLPASLRGIAAQAAAVLGLLTGVWVALSPYFIALQSQRSNAAPVELISGLAVAAVGAFALASPRGFPGLQLGNLLLGIWLIIAAPVLNQKHPITDSMYWSNSWSGRGGCARPPAQGANGPIPAGDRAAGRTNLARADRR